MWFRLLAAIMFTLAGGCAGIAFSQQLRHRQEVCVEIGSLLSDTAVCIRSVGMNVYDIAAKLRSEPAYKELSFLGLLPVSFSEGEIFREAWQNALNSQEFPEEEHSILAELGNMLGRTDAEGQLAGLDVLEERIRCLESERRSVFIEKGRMYRSAGVLFGVMAGILVI